jgi:hypothetical protein
MIWGERYIDRPVAYHPKHGDVRTVSRFAWVPTKLTDGRWAVFEYVKVKEQYLVNYGALHRQEHEYWQEIEIELE